MNKLHEIKSPLTGKPIPYVPAAATDIRANSFARARAELSVQKPAKENVRTLRSPK